MLPPGAPLNVPEVPFPPPPPTAPPGAYPPHEPPPHVAPLAEPPGVATEPLPTVLTLLSVAPPGPELNRAGIAVWLND